MKRHVFIIAMLITVFTSSGCAALIVGAGVGTAIAVSNDTAKLERYVSLDEAWNVTLDILDRHGTITSEDKAKGKAEAKIKKSEIVARVKQADSELVRITIQAREGILPNMELAMQVVNEINKGLE
jgi:hypothetical protein